MVSLCLRILLGLEALRCARLGARQTFCGMLQLYLECLSLLPQRRLPYYPLFLRQGTLAFALAARFDGSVGSVPCHCILYLLIIVLSALPRYVGSNLRRQVTLAQHTRFL